MSWSVGSGSLSGDGHGPRVSPPAPPDHPRLADYVTFLKVQLTREFAPLSHVEVATINGEPAATSPYAERLAELFRLTREGKSVRLWKRY